MRGRGQTRVMERFSAGYPLARLAACGRRSQRTTDAASEGPGRQERIVSWSRPDRCLVLDAKSCPTGGPLSPSWGRRWSEERRGRGRTSCRKPSQAAADGQLDGDPRPAFVHRDGDQRDLVLQRVRREQIVAIADIPAPTLARSARRRAGRVRNTSPRARRSGRAHRPGDVERSALGWPTGHPAALQVRGERTPREIALALGISVSTVDAHLARVQQQLVAWRSACRRHPRPTAQ